MEEIITLTSQKNIDFNNPISTLEIKIPLGYIKQDTIFVYVNNVELLQRVDYNISNNFIIFKNSVPIGQTILVTREVSFEKLDTFYNEPNISGIAINDLQYNVIYRLLDVYDKAVNNNEYLLG